MSADLFNMIAEQPEVSVAHNEYETAISDLRAQVMTALDEEMFKEQEMWCLKWQKKLTRLTTALRGLGLGVPKDAPSFAAAHNTWKRWGVEAAVRRQEAEEREVAAREVREREEQIKEEERARAAGSSEVGGEAETGGPAEQFQEVGVLEEDASAMVISPAVTPTRKGKERDPRLSITVPAQGLSQIAGPACMAGGSNTITWPVDVIVEIELLEYEGVSGVPNEAINTVLSLAAKARLQDANVEVRDAIEGQKRYHEQLGALESQVARLVQEARACPLEDTSAFK
ncbi:hypothetical protein PAXRUDRAFT_15217 [Paxillus rubicundulus Ve08.2h10]|uniref:Uncharacterized protein n=1 Tax=Paxillus rubicundulus Ve08.2h10 TaxID=930991 RepID=A0A0D0CFM1_9AGAM|nr:hypothetical protein PAXRUDRAFT_15217 [Paxillus rubicundulus Ve08.2h10]